MSNEEKFLSALDKQNDSINDFVKSHEAEVEANKKGAEALDAEIKAIRTQMQELAETTKTVKAHGPDDIVAAFGKSIVDSAHGKAAGEGTTTAGGYVVETEQMKQILSVQNQYGIVRQIFGAAIIPMATDTAKIPVDTFEESGASGTGNVPTPAATDENAAIAASADAELDQVSLTAEKIATLNYVSNELIDDSFVDFLGAYLIPKIARQAAKLEDQTVFTTSTTGLFNTSNVTRLVMDSGSSAFSALTYEQLIEMEDEVVDDALMDGQYFMHRSILSLVKKMKGTDGHPLWMPASGPEPATINGYGYTRGSVLPARKSTAVSTGFAAFGDITKACVVGERLTRRIVTDSSFRFNYDQLTIRMTERFAYNTNANIGKALCVLATAAE